LVVYLLPDTWYIPIQDAEDSKISEGVTTTTSELSVKSLTASDAGDYVCKPTYGAYTLPDGEAKLTVLSKSNWRWVVL
jgi:hypothetical protein